MIRFALTVLVACLLLGASTTVPAPVFDAESSAVNLAVANDGSYVNVCSGAVVGLERGPRVVSAGHCVADHFTGEYREQDYVLRDAEGNIYPATIEEFLFDPEVGNDDYAIFRSVYQYLAPAVPLTDEPLSTGDDVFAWSGPLGMDLVLLRGYVSGELRIDGGEIINDMLFVSMNADGGSSGSIILNSDGEATGILMRSWTADTPLYGVILSELPDLR